jgi:CubicO group peptidase (beta-lactamase class C family)
VSLIWSTEICFRCFFAKELRPLAAAIALVVSSPVSAKPAGRPADLPVAIPETLGFSSDRLNSLDEFYQIQVDRGEMAGIVILVARHGKVAHFSAIGYANIRTRQKMRQDSIFRLYSMTKPIAATALMTLYEEGKFQLDDPISKYIPEFKSVRVLRTPNSPLSDTVPAKREPTIHDLFRHTAGLEHGLSRSDAIESAYISAGITDPDVSLEEMTKRLSKIPLLYQPGTQFDYSLGQDLQARLVEIFSGMKFDAFLKQRLFEPLAMKDTAYWVTPEKASRLVAIHWIKDGKIATMEDQSGYPKPDLILVQPSDIKSYLRPHARFGGSYGLVGTAQDYWHFAQMMLDGGEFRGHRILSPITVQFMTRDHSGSTLNFGDEFTGSGWRGLGWGLGVALVKDAAASASMVPDGSFFWMGAANTEFWADRKNDVVVVAMTQSMDPNIEGQWTLREHLASMVYAALLNPAR